MSDFRLGDRVRVSWPGYSKHGLEGVITEMQERASNWPMARLRGRAEFFSFRVLEKIEDRVPEQAPWERSLSGIRQGEEAERKRRRKG